MHSRGAESYNINKLNEYLILKETETIQNSFYHYNSKTNLISNTINYSINSVSPQDYIQIINNMLLFKYMKEKDL